MDLFFYVSFRCPVGSCLIISALSRKWTSLAVIKLAARQTRATYLRPGRFNEIVDVQEGFKNFITPNFAAPFISESYELDTRKFLHFQFISAVTAYANTADYMKNFFLISNFRRVLNTICFLLSNSTASEFYMPTFRNTLSVPFS